MAKALVISVAFAANIGGVGTPTGTPPNLVLIGILPVWEIKKKFYKIKYLSLFPGVETGLNYLSWIVLTMPLMIFCLFMCWILLTLIFLRNDPKVDETVGIMLNKQNQGLPPMRWFFNKYYDIFSIVSVKIRNHEKFRVTKFFPLT